MSDSNLRSCRKCKTEFQCLDPWCVCPQCSYRFRRDRWAPPPPSAPEHIEIHASKAVVENRDKEFIDIVFSDESSFILSFHEATAKRERRMTDQSRGASDGIVSVTRLCYEQHDASCSIDERLECAIENGWVEITCCESVYQGPRKISITFDPIKDWIEFRRLFAECLRQCKKVTG